MISEALLVPFVLWCAYSPITTELPSGKGDFALEPLPCTQRYETGAGCLKAQPRVDPKWAPQCLPLTEVQTRDRLDQLRLDNAPPAYRPEPVAHLLWCDTKVVIGCNQYYKDSDACYTQWLKTPNIVEPRCLPAAPNASQSDFGSPARIPEAVKVFFERHQDSIDAQHQRLPSKRGDTEPPLGSRPTGYGVPEIGPGKQSVSEPLPLQFMIQLGIFRTEAEAGAMFERIRQHMPHLARSLQPIIRQTDLGESGIFYRLNAGPIWSREEAVTVCKRIVRAGQKQCNVLMDRIERKSIYSRVNESFRPADTK